jgi:hypothetical protein
MVMFLMVACMAMFGLAVTALAFGAATRDEPVPERPAEKRQPMAPSRFFVSPGALDGDFSRVGEPALAAAQVPIEVLLLRLERHVRLEQAAAEAFLDSPTVESLHSRTASPLIH